MTPAEQEYYDDEVKLRDRGFPENEITEAVALLKLADEVIRKREAWEKFAQARTAAQQKPWFQYLDFYPVKLPRQAPVWQSPNGGR